MEPEHTDTEKRAALDIGPDLFDWEEFDSPDEDTAKRRREEVQFLRSTVEKFTSEHQEWTFETIPQKVQALAQQIKEYEDAHGEIEFLGYMAVRALPALSIFVLEEAQSILPISQQLRRDQTDKLIFEIAKLLDPHRFYDTLVRIVNYVDLLDHTTENDWMRTLSTDMSNWLQTNAKHALSNIQTNLEGNGMPENPEEKLELNRQIMHLSQVARGQLPFGYNSETEQRWELWDMEFLLDPSGDLREEKLVTRKSYDYVMRQARERMELIESERMEHRQPLGQAQQAEEERLLQHYKRIYETGQLPYGYRSVDEAIHNDEQAVQL